MTFVIWTSVLAVVTAVTCAIPGVFVVLRKNSMLVDAISHAVLPGIVVGYVFTQNLDSPVLLVGAALSGLVVVLGSEWLTRSGLVAGDAPQGLIFPALFSVGVILVTANFANVHLDVHAVLVGDLNVATVPQLMIGGTSIGPAYLYVMLGMLGVNIVFLALFFKQMKVTTFDPEFARVLGVRSGLVNTAFMFTVSLTVTTAFHAAGAVLVVALMVVPAATAFLVSARLPAMIALTVVIAAASAIAGFWLAYAFDAATSAGMAVFSGCVFVAVAGAVRARERLRHRDPDRVRGGPAERDGRWRAVDRDVERV